MDHGLRRSALSARLAEMDVDAVYLTRLPNVRYLTGFRGSNGQLLLAADGAVFMTDGRYDEQSRQEVLDVERRIYLDGVAPVLAACADLGIRRLGFETHAMTYRAWAALRDQADGVELIPLGAEVERQRLVKDADEVASIAASQEAADAAFEAFVLGGGLREGITERDVALALEDGMRRAGADDKGFPTIVAFGDSAAEPHHRPTDRPLARGDVVKLDFGALVDGYHSDMTRTVAFGEPDPRLREIREVVAAAQRAGAEAVRPGATVAEIDGAARRVVEDAGYGPSFPHGLGHGVGLEIHEDPFLRRDRGDVVPLGAVVTIEPGVYVPGLGGVRIEDMVEVTADGGRPFPRSTKELMVA